MIKNKPVKAWYKPNTCTYCGGTVLMGYKGRRNGWKCIKCSRYSVGKLTFTPDADQR
jgi:tRNA(Ile2) C34 agmatinyltransferase TiaS